MGRLSRMLSNDLSDYAQKDGGRHTAEQKWMERSDMEVISGIVFSICLLILFCFGYFLGYRNGMETMKKIDDGIIEEAKRVIYGEE